MRWCRIICTVKKVRREQLERVLRLFLASISLILPASADTASDIADYILGKTSLNQDQIEQLDQNADHQLTVADLVHIDKSNVPFAFFAGLSDGAGGILEGSAATSSLAEGESLLLVVFFTKPVTDNLILQLAGSAGHNLDYSCPASIPVSNSDVVIIPILAIDDGLADGPSEKDIETIEITIRQGQEYLPGDAITHSVFIANNDSTWEGLMDFGFVQLHFQLELVRSLAGNSGSMTTDGYGIVPINENSPNAGWPLSSVSLSETEFTANVTGIDVSASSSLIGVDFERQFIFTAEDSVHGGNPVDNVDPGIRITGTVTENFNAINDAFAYLNKSSGGNFTLVRRPSEFDTANPALVDVPLLTKLSPDSGQTSPVTIEGRLLSEVTAVTFDNTPATIISNDGSRIRVIPPARAAGPVPVRVSRPGSVLNALVYTYVP